MAASLRQLEQRVPKPFRPQLLRDQQDVFRRHNGLVLVHLLLGEQRVGHFVHRSVDRVRNVVNFPLLRGCTGHVARFHEVGVRGDKTRPSRRAVRKAKLRAVIEESVPRECRGELRRVDGHFERLSHRRRNRVGKSSARSHSDGRSAEGARHRLHHTRA